jgi:hypothetical protein
MTQSETIAIVLSNLVDQIANDMLNGRDSGAADLYFGYVKNLTIEEGSY